MELVSLRTDEEVDSLTIGDCFQSGLTGARYEITDLVRSVKNNRISSLQTKLIQGPSIGTHIRPVPDGQWWGQGSIYNNFLNRGFKKVFSKDYDPSQQPYTEEDI